MGNGPIGYGATTEYLSILSTTRKTIAASGTSERIATVGTGSGIIIIQALVGNTANVFIGGPATGDAKYSATVSSQRGIQLEPGQTITLPLRETTSIWCDVAVSGEGVSFIILG